MSRSAGQKTAQGFTRVSLAQILSSLTLSGSWPTAALWNRTHVLPMGK